MRLLRSGRHLFMPLALLTLVWIVFSIRDASFWSTGNVYAVLTSAALVALVAAGEGVTMLMGEGDLSVGSVAALAGTMTIQLAHLGIAPAIAITVLALTAFGAVQGYVVHRLNINSLVLTIGSLIGISGLAYVVSGNTTIALPPDRISAGTTLTEHVLTVFSPMALVAIGFVLITWLVLTYTRAGREIYALGGGRREAIAAGVSVRSRFVGAFACSAGASALGGSLVAITSGGATPGGTASLLLSAFTAVLVGGVAVTGGVGSMIGVFAGALAIQSIASGVAIEGAASDVSDLMTAGLLVLVLAFDAVFQWLPSKRASSALEVEEAVP